MNTLTILWGPLTSRQIRDRNDVVLIKEVIPADRWNVAIAVRAEGGLLEQGAVARILAEADVPFLPPYPVAAPLPGD